MSRKKKELTPGRLVTALKQAMPHRIDITHRIRAISDNMLIDLPADVLIKNPPANESEYVSILANFTVAKTTLQTLSTLATGKYAPPIETVDFARHSDGAGTVIAYHAQKGAIVFPAFDSAKPHDMSIAWELIDDGSKPIRLPAETLRALRQIATHAELDVESSQKLVFGYVELKPDRIAATDGKRLARYDAPTGLPHGLQLFLSAWEIQKIKTLETNLGAIKEDQIELVDTGQGWALVLQFNAGRVAILGQAEQFNMPDMDRVVPNYDAQDAAEFRIDWIKVRELQADARWKYRATRQMHGEKLSKTRIDFNVELDESGHSFASIACANWPGLANSDDMPRPALPIELLRGNRNPLGITLNWDYVEEAIDIIPNATIRALTALAPVLFRSADQPEFTIVVMPIKR